MESAKKLLSMSEVAKLLQITTGDKNRKVRKMLRSIEEQRNIKVLIERNKHFYTTLPILKTILPEAFQEDVFIQETLSSLREAINILNQRLNQLTYRFAASAEDRRSFNQYMETNANQKKGNKNV